MITRYKLRRGGVLEGINHEIGSRRSQTPQTILDMTHEEGQELMFEDESAFTKDLYDMSKMVKVFYNEIKTRL